jgi:hypothetical protein
MTVKGEKKRRWVDEKKSRTLKEMIQCRALLILSGSNF